MKRRNLSLLPKTGRRALALLVLAASGLAGASGGLRAEPLIADLSRDLIEITTGFIGTDVLIFGAVEGEGDVLVVVRGPETEMVVRQKERIAGIWVNRHQLSFQSVPSFYSLASSGPLLDSLPEELLQRHGIGIDHLDFGPEQGASREDIALFRRALVRNLQRESLYGTEVGEVTFLGSGLFRLKLFFPANVSTGSHRVEIYLLRGGEIASAKDYPLTIRKIGVGAEIFRFAHDHPAGYGAIAIVIAMFAGWLASVIFRKR